MKKIKDLFIIYKKFQDKVNSHFDSVVDIKKEKEV